MSSNRRSRLDIIFNRRTVVVTTLLAWTFSISGGTVTAVPTPHSTQTAAKLEATPAPSTSSKVFVPAEGNLKVAVIEVNRSAKFTTVRLQTQSSLKVVCWANKGPDAPYLEIDGQTFRFLGGDNITTCPAERDYAEHEEMVLRFEPLDANVRKVSLIEGKGGRDQLLSRPSATGRTYWNFLNIATQ